MNTCTYRSGLRRTVLSVCLAAALGSGAAFAAHNNGPRPDPMVSTWAQLHRANVDPAAQRGDWRTRFERAAAHRTTGTPGPTVTVTSCGDSGPGTLRDVAASAVDGTTIDLSGLSCPGSTISLTSGAVMINPSAGVYLLGPGGDQLTIDGGGNDRVLVSRGFLQVSNVTIANGHANGPGGCILAYEDVLLKYSTVTGCHVEGDGSGTATPPLYLGGGIASTGMVIVSDSTVSGNNVSVNGTAYGAGGGVFAMDYALALTGSRIENNTVTATDGDARGGGMYSSNGMYLYQSSVTGNTVTSTNGTAYGGGLHLNYQTPLVSTGTGSTQAQTGGGGSAVTLKAMQSTISGNTAHSENNWAYGGGIQTGVAGGPMQGVELSSSTISGNAATSACENCFILGGGAVAFGQIVSYYSTVSDNSVLLTNNTAAGAAYGGGLASHKYSITVVNSTVSGNHAAGPLTASGVGGGISSRSYVDAFNSTVAFNEASTSGGGVYAASQSFWFSTIMANNQAPAGGDAIGGFTVTGDHNLVMAPDAGITLPAGTLSDDPLLLPLHGNGGSTATHSLVVCSPAIDAGSNPKGLTQDQRGAPFSRSWGASQDIGAFELQPDPDHIFGNGFDPDPCPPPG